MLKREITYEDFFTEEETSATFYFNLTERELTRFEAELGGNVEERMTMLMQQGKTAEMMDVFENLILSSYGVREGNEFVKDEDVKKRFLNSAAYNALFVEISSDMGALVEFMRGIIPKKMRGQFAEAEKEVAARMEKALQEAPEPEVMESPQPPAPPQPPSE